MNELSTICSLFTDLSDADIQLVEAKMNLRDFRNKEYVLREGNDNNNIYIIKSGVVRVDTFNSSNRRQTLSFLKEGDFFGEIAVFTGSPVSANVVSVVASQIYILKKADIDELILQIPQLARNIIYYLANRVKHTDGVIYDYAFKMLEARVASKLINLMHMFKGQEGSTSYIDLPITHQDLADFVGTSRETVTKILAKFKDRNLIEIQTKKILILDEQRLEAWGAE